MARESNRISSAFYDTAKKGKATPGIYRDGGGLLLRIEDSGSARWVLRINVRGKRRDIGLGSASETTLADVRERAAEMRKLAHRGQDPTTKARGALTFAEAAEKVHELRMQDWRNGKHTAQWLQTLKTYAYPRIGRKDVGEVDPSDVEMILAPLWQRKAETARRVKQRISLILDWAQAKGYRDRLMSNAADVAVVGLGKQKDKAGHHEALPWKQVHEFVKAVRACPSNEAARLALEFATLVAGRTSEILLATKDEIDLDASVPVWVVPAHRMKAEVEHRVPLSPQAVTLLRTAFDRWPKSTYVFPGRFGKALSNMAMLMLMRRLGMGGTPHGLRSSFRDWTVHAEADDNASEACLAHVVGNKTTRAYRRTDYFDQRIPIMRAWGAFVATGEFKKMGEGAPKAGKQRRKAEGGVTAAPAHA
jgi:integrase